MARYYVEEREVANRRTTYIEPFWDIRGRLWKRRVLMYRVRDDGPGTGGPFRTRREAQKVADVWEAWKVPERRL